MNTSLDNHFEELTTLFEQARADHERASLKNNKSAARRARTTLSKLVKGIKSYRSASLTQFSE